MYDVPIVTPVGRFQRDFMDEEYSLQIVHDAFIGSAYIYSTPQFFMFKSYYRSSILQKEGGYYNKVTLLKVFHLGSRIHDPLSELT